MKILIVDDDLNIRLMLRDALNREHDILEASNGVDGSRVCFEKNPDLVITDMMMPRMPSDIMIKVIRERRPWVKFIATSASIGWDLPADVPLLLKPYNIQVLKDMVNADH